MGKNEGWGNVGVDPDTAEFAVESIRGWWRRMGRRAYPDATELLITADGGGSNSYRTRLWNVALQEFATTSGLRITVTHSPPGTSTWHTIEHRLFSHITQHWRGRPLESLATIGSLIGSTTTATGLRVRAALDRKQDRTAQKVTDATVRRVNPTPQPFHGEWHYTIAPRPS